MQEAAARPAGLKPGTLQGTYAGAEAPAVPRGQNSQKEKTHGNQETYEKDQGPEEGEEARKDHAAGKKIAAEESQELEAAKPVAIRRTLSARGQAVL